MSQPNTHSKKVIRPKPSRFRIKVGRSKAGLGLFALENIKKGAKIIEYGGYLLTNDEAEKKGGKYLFEVLESDTTIDGTPRWNMARYANHSCKPNCEGVWYGKHIWLCAKRNIRAGEELTYHYGRDYYRNMIGGQKFCRCVVCRSVV